MASSKGNKKRRSKAANSRKSSSPSKNRDPAELDLSQKPSDLSPQLSPESGPELSPLQGSHGRGPETTSPAENAKVEPILDLNSIPKLQFPSEDHTNSHADSTGAEAEVSEPPSNKEATDDHRSEPVSNENSSSANEASPILHREPSVAKVEPALNGPDSGNHDSVPVSPSHSGNGSPHHADKSRSGSVDLTPCSPENPPLLENSSSSLSPGNPPLTKIIDEIDLDELEDLEDQVVSAVPVKIAPARSDQTSNSFHATQHLGESTSGNVSSDVPLDGLASTTTADLADPNSSTKAGLSNGGSSSTMNELLPALNDEDGAEPEIPQRSVARAVEPESVEMLQARHQKLGFARPVMLVTGGNRHTGTEEPQGNDSAATFDLNGDVPAFDPDQYFNGSDDEIVTVGQEDTNHSFSKHDTQQRDVRATTFLNEEAAQAEDTEEASLNFEIPKAETELSPRRDTIRRVEDPDTIPRTNNEVRGSGIDVVPDLLAPRSGTDLSSSPQDIPLYEGKEGEFSLASPLASPQASPRKSPPRSEHDIFSESPSKQDYLQWTKTGGAQKLNPSERLRRASDSGSMRSHQLRNLNGPVRLDPPLGFSSKRLSAASLSSPTASPRPYKYAQSPLPTETDPNFRPEPPIFGVGVVGFHHQRGPEVEYWVGPDSSKSNMWPYLPFQSLPDGSHQFEENISYFTLLYDRNKAASTSLTFTRDDEGHIQAGTSDFRNVTTLFGIACSRQMAANELDSAMEENQEYTRSVVQKSVFVIASKPIFGPIKEKLTVVTRSYFEQHNFGDRTIIDNFYDNLVHMPLWINENDLQVGMNLQRCVHDFGTQVLVILKAMLLESKILFYANDTDVLGTTQFALISLIPNLINHLEDSGSPLLSSYELNLETPASLRTRDRQSLLRYCGFPLQIFAGGGVFSPFVPLQQFDDLRQPETRYGMMGTTNNLFLGNEIDFDIVVNIETHSINIRNPSITPLLKLSDADKAFAQKIIDDVNNAWDVEDRWQPQALGYIGGEDYIRHEIEEYLMALLASAKEIKFSEAAHQSQNNGSQGGDANSTKSASSSTTSLVTSTGNSLAWNKQWLERWMTTNNYRIFNKYTDPNLFHLVSSEHPGARLVKPSGLDRFFGFFKKPNPIQAPISHDISQINRSGSSSTVNTPSLKGLDETFEPVTPAKDFTLKSDTPTERQREEPKSQETPRSWFSRRE